MSSSVKTQSPNHWATREFPMTIFFYLNAESLTTSTTSTTYKTMVLGVKTGKRWCNWERESIGGQSSTFGIVRIRLKYPMMWGHSGSLCNNTADSIQRRRWQPTPVLLPGISHGRRSLVGCSPQGRTESDTTEQLHFHASLSHIEEGNGNPLQCSCLENPRDGEPGGLPSMGSHRIRHDWSALAAAADSMPSETSSVGAAKGVEWVMLSSDFSWGNLIGRGTQVFSKEPTKRPHKSEHLDIRSTENQEAAL